MEQSLLDSIRKELRGPGRRRYGRKLVVRNPIDIITLAKLLSSETRLFILKYLSKHGPASISELAEKTGLSIANISIQVKLLEKADLVETVEENGRRGIRRVVSLKVDKIYLFI